MTKIRSKKIISLLLAVIMLIGMMPMGIMTVSAADAPATTTIDGKTYYQLSTVDDLYWFAAEVNGGNNTINGILLNDITVNTGVLKSDGTLADDTSSFREWTPIGNASVKYAGTFDGNNYAIKGLYFNNSDTKNVGLFGYTNGAAIKNVGVEDSYLYGLNQVGGVVGNNDYGTVTNCYNTGTVTSSGQFAGGVVGFNDEGTVTNSYNTGTVTSSGQYAGGVVGYNDEGTVTNSYNTGTVTAGSSYVGGVVGCNSFSSTVTNSYNTGAVTGSSYYVGGVVGRNCYYGAVTNSYNTGTVSGSSDFVGGVVGYNSNSSTVTNSYNTGAVTGGSYNVGGVVGYNAGSTVTNCYYLTGCAKDGNNTVQYGIGNETTGSTTADVEGQTTSKSAEQFASGEVAYLLNNGVTDGTQAWYQNIDNGETVDAAPKFTGGTVYENTCVDTTFYSNTSGNKTAHTAPEGADCTKGYECEICKTELVAPGTAHTFDDNGFDCSVCDAAYQPATLVTNENYSTLGLTSGYVGYYAISNAGQLYWFAAEVNGGNNTINGILLNDITVNTSSSREWTPIGNDSVNYAGTFDGNNYAIKGLYFNNSDTKYVGLFGYTNGAAIKNVGVEDSYFRGKYYVGGVVGYNQDGTVTNSYNTGRVIGLGSYVGGVVGYNKEGTVTNCYNTGTVTAGSSSYSWVGGVVGCNSSSSTVTNSYNTGNVTGSGNFVGGVAGDNHGTITNSYNTGKVTGSDDYVGGVLGRNYDSTITNIYNTGAVNGKYYVGGVVGYNQDGTVTNSYNTGTVTGTTFVGGVVGDNYGTITNSYNLDTCGATGFYGKSATSDKFKSGYVAYLLNSGKTDGTQTWYQNIDNGETVDAAPKFTGGTVYENTCVDTTFYSNTSGNKTAHTAPEGADCTKGYECKICKTAVEATSDHTAPETWESAEDYVCTVCGTPLHLHDWEYTVDSENENTIIATCENTDGCPDTNGGTFTISAPAELYTDGVIAREAVIDNKLVDTEAEISAVTYSTSDGKAPTKPGTYTATVSVEGIIASVEFTLLSYVASVTIGSETKNYATVDEAWAAAKGNTATLTLIDNCTTESGLMITGGDVTLDTAEYTLTAKKFEVYGGKLTVKGSGELVNTQTSVYCFQVSGGEFVLESGTVGSIAVYVYSADAKATINGGTVNGAIVGDDNSDTYSATFIINNGTVTGSLFINGTPDVQLNGGEFTADSTYIGGNSDYTFADILGEGKAYYNANGEMIVLTEGQTQINEPFTVGDIADEIARIKTAVEAYDIDTVTSADIQGISALIEDIANVKASAGLTAEQTATLDASDATLDSLVERLTEVGNEIKRIDAAVTAYDINTVKSSDKAAVEQLKRDIGTLINGNNLSDSERELLENHDATLDNLLAKISSTADEINRIVAFINFYNVGFVKSSDKAEFQQIIADIKALTDGQNITEEERADLEFYDSYADKLVAKIDEVAAEITRLENAVNAYGINTVKSSDKADIEQLKADIEALTDGDNITDDERTKLNDLDTTLDNLLAKNSETAAEIARIEEAVNAYDEATVKSTDKADIQQLIADIKALTDGQNITDDERANLEALDAKADTLVSKIDETASEIARIESAVNAYDIDTVKSSDKADIQQLIADIKALTDGDNITAEERTNLEALDTTLDELLAKISETAAEIARLETETGKYDESTVKSSDLDALNKLDGEIYDLALTDNVTAEEKAKLEELHDKVFGLIRKIVDVSEEIVRIVEAIDAYVFDSVKSSDKAAIEQLIADIKVLTDGDNITADERAVLVKADETADKLLEKIADTAEEIKRIDDATNAYDINTVTSADKADIEKLLADSKTLQDGDNITEAEEAALKENDATLNALLAKIAATAEEIARIEEAVNGYDEDTVKSSDAEAIDKLIEDIKALTDGKNITEDEKAALEALDATADELNEKIDEVAAEKKRVEDAVNGYSEDTVKSSDTEAIEQLKDDIQSLIDSGNVTEEEIKALEETLADADALTDKIDEVAAEKERIEDAVAAYDEETVKSSDTEAIEQLKDDIQALIDSGNVTEEEIKALEETKADADALTDKIDEVAAEKKRIEDAVAAYDEETVKSSDTEAIEQLKDDIQTLIDSGNVTEEEIKALEETLADADALTDKIEETAQAMADTADKADDFDPATVTSDDKEAINDIIADIDEIIASGNATTEEIADLNETKAELNALIAKFNEATAKVEALGVEMEMFDKDRVTKFWEDDIEALIAEIETLLADTNMGTAEKAKLNEYKAQAEEMLEIINTPKEYFSLRFFYLIWDCLTWKYNGILWLFSKIFSIVC